MSKPTADPVTELSSCCRARVTYMEGELSCKACYRAVEWENDPGAEMGVDTFGVAIRLTPPDATSTDVEENT